MEYTLKEVLDAFVQLCHTSYQNLEWCGGECPLYKKYGDECSSLLTIAEEDAEEWARTIMEWKEQNT